jgi:two-component system chemotaxis sensor kinase CheA
MNDDMGKYKEAYLSEARTHVKDMNSSLIEWEKHPNETMHLQDIFRMAHTLKGISATMGYQKIAEFCHVIEDLLDSIRQKETSLKDCTDLLFSSFDCLGIALEAISENKPESDFSEVTNKIKDFGLGKTQKVSELPNHLNGVQSIISIEVKVERLDKLLNLTKELLVNKMRLESLSETLQSSELSTTVDIMNRTISELQYHVMQIRLVPIGFVFDRFTRMVRDLAKQQHKEVELKMEGKEIELDRSLIDGISEALTHLIRNAVDHGLEVPAVRNAKNKSPVGKIELSAKREKEALVIEVRDNGAGLDVNAIKNAALQRNFLTNAATRDEIMDSVFKGISTSKQVTSISGRGLGLGIVRQKIESINGSITVATKEGEGTAFLIKIPLTLAVIYVLLVRQGLNTYAIPLNSIERLITLAESDVKGLLSDEAFIYDNSSVPLVKLSSMFSMPSLPKSERKSIVVLRKDGNLLGVIVDTLLTTEEIITQPINTVIKASKLFSGTALLGSGEMILILDIEQLFIANIGLKKELEFPE